MLNLISNYVMERASGLVLAAILVRHFGEKPVILPVHQTLTVMVFKRNDRTSSLHYSETFLHRFRANA